MLRTSALLVLLACGGGGYVLPDLNPAPGHNVRRIQGAGAMLRYDWEHSGWGRPNDPLDVTMVYFVVAYDGSACIVPSRLWAAATAGDTVRCAPWRMPR